MRLLALLLIVAFAAGGWYLFSAGESFSEQAVSSSGRRLEAVDPCEAAARSPSFVRRQSCNSTACHGAVRPASKADGILRNEYRVWFDSDPHAHAARVLGNEVSQQMVKHLAGDSAGAEDYRKIYKRCFACHNTTVANIPDRLIETMAYFDQNPEHEGVGCQACHGPASEWENIHYFDCWKQISNENKRRLGLRDTKPLAARVELCARCHVGEAGRDVDHDLIAAGHPQMKFEMLGYHALMPHHWNSEEDRSAHPEFETALWLAGQRASARAALALLESRADRAATSSAPVWPEFSEYDCFACHHDLEDDSWRRDRGFSGSGQRVRLPWGVWHFAVLPGLAKQEGEPAGQSFFEAHQKLEAMMHSRLAPDPHLVKTQAGEAMTALENWKNVPLDPGATSRLRSYLEERGGSEQLPRNWDEAVQLYLAAYAVRESARSSLPEEATDLESDFKKLRTSLGFPENYRSPRKFPAAPGSKDDVRGPLRNLLKNLPR